MAEKKTPEGAPRRKREAPTIDLTAEDVTPPTATPEPPDAAPPANEPEQAASSEPPIQPPPEPPWAAESTPEEQPAAVAAASVPWGSLIAAGVIGGVIVAAALGGLWYGDMLPVRSVTASGNGDQIAALQKQVQDLQSRPAGDGKAVEALTQRIGKIEDALKTAPKGDGNLGDRLTAAENAMKSLGVALTALNQRSDDATANAARARDQADAAEKAVAQLRGSVQDAAKDASSAATPEQVNALTQRLAALEQAGKTARYELGKLAAGEKATRLALSAAALREAVRSGQAFTAELAQAKALGAPDKYTTVLAPFASSSLPSAAALAQELRAILPKMVSSSGAAPSGSFLERLQANASKLVKVTPVDAPPGDDPTAVLSRLELEAAHADIAGALADLDKLPDATRAPAQGFIAKAKAREAALAASRDLAADTSRALTQR